MVAGQDLGGESHASGFNNGAPPPGVEDELAPFQGSQAPTESLRRSASKGR